MRAIVAFITCCVSLLLAGGCESPPVQTTAAGGAQAEVTAGFLADRIDLLPLTSFSREAGAEHNLTVSVFVSMIDAFGSQIKSPGTFRFELYEYAQRTSDHKGKRIIIWPDMDLSDPSANNRYWRDFLRAYQFELPAAGVQSDNCILQVTCLLSSGRRLTAEAALKRSQ